MVAPSKPLMPRGMMRRSTGLTHSQLFVGQSRHRLKVVTDGNDGQMPGNLTAQAGCSNRLGTVMILLLAFLSSEPMLVHTDVQRLCPPGARAALQGAPPECLHEAVQRMERQLERIERRYLPSK